MTTLFEKALLTGFGLFILIIFFSIINPFLGEIANYYKNVDHDNLIYSNFINEIDNAINSIIEKPNETYLKEVKYPEDLNITFYGNIAKFEYFLQYQLYSINKEYLDSFVECYYYNVFPNTYILIISYKSNLIDVSFN
ncbi:MAG: hypothetical protein ACFE85_14530 [Candidatus Hodarchaeota archaeon]